MTSQSTEEESLLKIQAKFNKLLSLNKCNHISSSDTTMLLNELILRLCDLKKRDEELSSCIQVGEQCCNFFHANKDPNSLIF